MNRIPIMLDFVLFDMIGTTIREDQDGESLILRSFSEAFIQNGLEVSLERIGKERGKLKKEAIENILEGLDHSSQLISSIYSTFIGLLDESIQDFNEIQGGKILFELLKKKGIKIGLGSGLPLNFMYKIIQQVGWDTVDFDYISSSEGLGKGRPDPVMIKDAMSKLGLTDKSKILKVGDTQVDIMEGKNAGVLTAGVLTGALNRHQLEACEPGFVLSDINELQKLLLI